MSRRWYLSVAAAAIGAMAASGCAHCDTCDDFPAPCVGSNCGGVGGTYAVAAPMDGAMMMGTPTMAVETMGVVPVPATGPSPMAMPAPTELAPTPPPPMAPSTSNP